MIPSLGADVGASRWPWWSMVLYGHFGPEASLESRRADARSRLAIAGFVLAAIAVTLAPGLEPTVRSRTIAALVPPLLAYLAWERWRYALGLDELARRLYLEAFAITYLSGLALFSVFGLLDALAGWQVPPLAFVALEPIRAAVLAWRSRPFA
jgi:hypothetical protein